MKGIGVRIVLQLLKLAYIVIQSIMQLYARMSHMLKNILTTIFNSELHNFHVPRDAAMMALMQNNGSSASHSSADIKTVNDWMREYGLFQGINGGMRSKIVNAALNTVPTISMPTGATRTRNDIETAFRLLYTKLHSVSKRKCISATSKLLWCRFPDDIVIYDSFVERAVTVLQHIDSSINNLTPKPILGSPPNIIQ
jgi:hypothetical protein